MDKNEFKQIFDNCMKQTRYWAGCFEEGADHFCDIEPHITIRNFGVPMPKLSDSNFNVDFDLNKCDKEFTNFEDAWEYFNKIHKYRIMDATGQIWADNYCSNPDMGCN